MTAKPVRRAKPHHRARHRPVVVADPGAHAPAYAGASHLRSGGSGAAPPARRAAAPFDLPADDAAADDWLAALYARDDAPRHRPGLRDRLRTRGSRP